MKIETNLGEGYDWSPNIVGERPTGLITVEEIVSKRQISRLGAYDLGRSAATLRPNTFDKIMQVYAWGVTKEPFVYQGVRYLPKTLKVSPLIFRDLDCPSGCGACCSAVVLNYLPHENHPYPLEEKWYQVNDQEFLIFEDTQEGARYHCKNLNLEDGRCMIHTRHALGCDFELLRFIHGNTWSTLIHKLFGRGWNMLRIDGERGSRCSMMPFSDSTIPDISRKLRRLKDWMDYLQLDTHLPEVITWVESGPHTDQLVLQPTWKKESEESVRTEEVDSV